MRTWTQEELVSTFGYNSHIQNFKTLIECWNIIGDNYTIHDKFPNVYIIEDSAYEAAIAHGKSRLSKKFCDYALKNNFIFCRKSDTNKIGTESWIYSTFGPTDTSRHRGMTEYDWSKVEVVEINEEEKYIVILPQKVDYKLSDPVESLQIVHRIHHSQSQWRILDGRPQKKQYKPKSRGIYGIYLNDELIYIGMTWWQNFETRWRQHKNHIKAQDNALYVYSLLKPTDNIKFVKLIDINNIELSEGEITEHDVKMMELALIREHRPRGNLSGNTMAYRL